MKSSCSGFADSSSGNGSVLLETVLVLPLLVLVFGGLFTMGDLLHGRLHLQTVERVAAWLPGSRFTAGRGDVVARAFPHLPAHTALSVEKAHADWFATGTDRQLRGTEWLDFTGGRADARVDVPFWAAMANTPAVVWGRPQGEWLSATWRYHAKGASGSGSETYRDWDRQFVVRRTPDSSVAVADKGEFLRTRKAAELGWFTIPLGGWPDGDKGLFFGVSLPALPKRSPFVRHPVALEVGE